MDEKDLLKVGIDAAFAPVRDLAGRLFGPFADELGGMLGDRFRVFRFRQTILLLEKVKRIAERTGFEPGAVPVKVLLPILDHAAIECDEDLHNRWAALLATACNPQTQSEVLPAFSLILAALTSPQAKMLDAIFQHVVNQIRNESDYRLRPTWAPMIELGNVTALIAFDEQLNAIPSPETAEEFEQKEYSDLMDRFRVGLDNLIRLGLLERKWNVGRSGYSSDPYENPLDAHPISLTPLGFQFVAACSGRSEMDEAQS
jgi:hypothetical protein